MKYLTPKNIFYAVLSIAIVWCFFFGHAAEGIMLGMAFPTPNVTVPFGGADVESPAYAATIAITITNQLTFIQPGTLTGALTLNLTIDPSVKPGAKIHCKLTSDTTARTTTFGTGFTSAALAGVINKTLVQTFVYDGTTFLPEGPGFQIN